MTGLLLAGLPALSTDEAYLRQAVAEALNGCEVGDDVMRAAFVDAGSGDIAWFDCGGGLAFALLRLDGADVSADPEDGAAAALLLERAEAMLAAIEAALSITLEPRDLAVRGDAPRSLVVRVDVEAAGHALLLLMPHDIAILPSPAPAAAALVSHVPVPFRIRFAGPRLSPGDAASIGPGDLLLIGSGPFDAVIEAGSMAPVPGQFDPAARRFRRIPN